MALFLEEEWLKQDEQWHLPNGTNVIARIKTDIFSNCISVY